MGAVRIVDTNVMIGLTIKQHIHHRNSLEFIEESSNSVYVAPTAKEEFDNLESEVRRELRREISKHQDAFDQEFGDWEGKLEEKHIQYLRDQVLDHDKDAAHFLKKWYDDLLSQNFVEIDPLRIEKELGDFVMEVNEDACKDKGGWRNLISTWGKDVDSHFDLKDDLLLPDGNDLEICVESHHISIEIGDPAVLGSADGDFIDHKKSEDGEEEPRSRKEDIKMKTDLDDVRDLRPDAIDPRSITED